MDASGLEVHAKSGELAYEQEFFCGGTIYLFGLKELSKEKTQNFFL